MEQLPPWLDAMLPFEHAQVQVGAYRMHVMETRAPAGAPVVLALHGNPTWGFLYRKVARALEGFRVVMPDLVGLGLSDKPADLAAHTLDMHATQIAGLVDALGLTRFVLLVQDWGGPIGGVACASMPERVAGLVVLNTVLSPPRPGFKATAFHRFAQTPLVSDLAFRVFGFPQRSLDSAQGDRASIRGDVARAYRWPLRGLANNAAPLALARMVPDSLAHPSIPALERCRAFIEAYTGPAAIIRSSAARAPTSSACSRARPSRARPRATSSRRRSPTRSRPPCAPSPNRAQADRWPRRRARP